MWHIKLTHVGFSVIIKLASRIVYRIRTRDAKVGREERILRERWCLGGGWSSSPGSGSMSLTSSLDEYSWYSRVSSSSLSSPGDRSPASRPTAPSPWRPLLLLLLKLMITHYGKLFSTVSDYLLQFLSLG